MTKDRISAFEASSDWRLRWAGHDVRCSLGRGGVTGAKNKREGDGATPLGRWPMRQVLYRADRLPKPRTGLPAVALSPRTGWCDDPAHRLYNRQVELPFPANHEKLWREDHIYDLILVLGYNDAPVIPGKGSAIFLHVARPDFSPTEGCVACGQQDLVDLLKAAGPGDELAIVRQMASPT
jgi:L,D-peptidoglycan transpeptidase YkuD (ErfK/YbiS/YcfS/YnhG family)